MIRNIEINTATVILRDLPQIGTFYQTLLNTFRCYAIVLELI